MAFKFIALSSLLAVVSADTLHHHPVTTYTHVANPAVDAVAMTHQNVVRTHDGIVSEYSKNIETPYFRVHKLDKRISNNVYKPIVEKTVSYATPAVTKSTHLSSPAQAVYAYHESTHPTYMHSEYQPSAVVYAHATPMTKTVSYATPAVEKTHSYVAPAQVYHHHQHEEPMQKVVKSVAQAPAVYHHAAPTSATYHHAVPAPAPALYHHAAPIATTGYNHGSAASSYSHNSPGVAAYGSSQTVHYSPAEMVSHMSFDGFGTHWGY
ncbi:larval/pupal cuticle protein H1C-like [Eurosta solidaginis]|uniref:larval/pupal cuticle protein H1C-like n=1 Tax=Eurosta solidaginis TaxID=178769 RepID=UPI0035309333